jgi:hypothetical protein
VGKGAVLVLGCSPNISCSNPPGISLDRVGGDTRARRVHPEIEGVPGHDPLLFRIAGMGPGYSST